MTLRRWGDVHAGGESCARAGEGVTFPMCKSVQYFLSYSGFKSRPSFSMTLYFTVQKTVNLFFALYVFISLYVVKLCVIFLICHLFLQC